MSKTRDTRVLLVRPWRETYFSVTKERKASL